MNKSYVVLAVLSLYLSAWAQPNDFKVGELYYSIISEEEKTVAVECGNKTHINSLLDMPSYNGRQYESSRSEISYVCDESGTVDEYGTDFSTYVGNYCEGEIVVPSTIEYQGTVYTVAQLANGAFVNCYRMTSITLPETLEYIGPGVFAGCEKLEELKIPDSVEEIGEFAFSFCSLKKIHWPTSTTTVPDYAFYSNHYVEYVIENGENIMVIGCKAFSDSSLKDFPYWDNLNEIGQEAFTRTPLPYVKIPEGCKLGDEAFNSCWALQTIDLPQDCPDNISVQFAYCKAVGLIRIAATVPPVLSEDWAGGVAKNCVLEVPEESLELYRAAEYWKNFSQIITSGVETVEASHFTAFGMTGALRVNSNREATVFDMQGTKLYAGVDFELRLPAGIYIVKSGEMERKVQVK